MNDLSFGKNGLVTERLGSSDLSATVPSQTLARDCHRRIVFGAANGNEWQIRRYLPSGKPDRSFGKGGEVVIRGWSYIVNWPGSDPSVLPPETKRFGYSISVPRFDETVKGAATADQRDIA